jgi:hypothetical protein
MQFNNCGCEYCMVDKQTNEKFERLMQVLRDENILECNMKYSYVGIDCMCKQTLCILLMFYVFCLTNTTKFEFVKRQYLHELMQTLN